MANVKYQVFVSSTFKDLRAHRMAARNAITEAGHIPVCLEHSGPHTDEQRDWIAKAIDGSQFYVIILGHCYGTVPKGQCRSYTELEWLKAKARNLKTLSFVMDEEMACRKRHALDRHTIDGRTEIAHEKAYQRFRQALTGDKQPYHSMFSTPAQIEKDLLRYFSQEHDVRGYMLETKDTARIIEITTKNSLLREVIERTGKFTKVVDRLSIATEKKQAVAEAFQQCHGHDISRGVFGKVFLESGSTLVYVAKALAAHLREHAKRAAPFMHPVITTNNALLFLDLWLCEEVGCRPEPDSPPVISERYGALYGPLTGLRRLPDYGLPALKSFHPEAWKAVKELGRSFSSTRLSERTLILAAASGLQISSTVRAIRPRDTTAGAAVPYTYEPVLKQLRRCRGFHVGSYENKLFKRGLYQTKAPAVVFLHDEKIDCEIEVGKCQFVFDNEEPWLEFVSDYPLSLWVACEESKRDEVLHKLAAGIKRGGWRWRTYGSASLLPVIIGENQAFRTAAKHLGLELALSRRGR